VLRPYQQDATDAIIDAVKKTIAPIIVDAATGAGKSHIIAAVAEFIFSTTGKRVLCLAPSRELVEQNHAKYLATGNPASIYSASAGMKCLRHPVVFGTPGTVKNRVSRFGKEFAMIIADECHGITPTIQTIIDRIREVNPNVRVVGLTATPYRLGTGYIYALDEADNPIPEHQTKEPYFTKCVFKIHARELIAQGYLTPPTIGAIGAGGYETAHLEVGKGGKFVASQVDKAFIGHGRKTSAIIADVVNNAVIRQGVMIFAATIQHAKECMASLPPELSAIITSHTKAAERKQIIEAFKSKRIKYIVNVSVLTTGFDAEHVDVIAILRATESVGLLQQIVGRGLRLCEGKADCLVLDYAENIDRHCPDGDIFAPDIVVTVSDKKRVPIEVACSDCGTMNDFSARPNEDGFGYSDDGYFLDLDGNQVEGDYGPIPSHFGRRCHGLSLSGGTYERCGHRWNGKDCPHCGMDNDIAARYCSTCKGEIVNPNEKLRMEFKALKRDPTNVQTDEVVSANLAEGISQNGNGTWRVDWITAYRTFSTWFQQEPKHQRALSDRDRFYEAFKDGATPETVTYSKNAASGFYQIHGYNNKPDEAPE